MALRTSPDQAPTRAPRARPVVLTVEVAARHQRAARAPEAFRQAAPRRGALRVAPRLRVGRAPAASEDRPSSAATSSLRVALNLGRVRLDSEPRATAARSAHTRAARVKDSTRRMAPTILALARIALVHRRQRARTAVALPAAAVERGTRAESVARAEAAARAHASAAQKSRTASRRTPARRYRWAAQSAITTSTPAIWGPAWILTRSTALPTAKAGSASTTTVHRNPTARSCTAARSYAVALTFT